MARAKRATPSAGRVPGHPRRGKRWYGHGLPYLKLGPLPGHLIVIEGTDGVGRSTQIELLRSWLEVEGYAVSNTGWARSPLLSETINEAMAGHELTSLGKIDLGNITGTRRLTSAVPLAATPWRV